MSAQSGISTGPGDTTGARPISPATSSRAMARDFVELLKPRVMSLVVFTGFVGMLAAPGTIHPVMGAIAILCIAVGAGASGCLNMWFDADIDAVMIRTRTRPIPRGAVAREDALIFGTILSVFSVTLMWLAVGVLPAVLLAGTIAFYVFVYTMFLKRRTAQNIVIGGAAGALPPVIGWAAVTGNVTIEPLILFLIIFMWTPPHFWALSLYRAGDYEKAHVPMMSVVAGKPATRLQILLYALVLAPITVLPSVLGFAGLAYGVLAGVLSAIFVALAFDVWRLGQSKDSQSELKSDRAARRLFAYSIGYLFLLFLGFGLEQLLGWA